MRELLCFGGPMNEQLVAIDGDRYLVPARIPEATWLMEDSLPTAEALRTIVYTVMHFRWGHSEQRCFLENRKHRGPCNWSGECLVAPGYPILRIVNTIDAIAGMSLLLAGPPGQVRKPQPSFWQRLQARFR